MTIIHLSPKYRVESYGNGLAYSVTRSDGASFFVQEAEATDFHHSIFEQDVVTFEDAIATLYGDRFASE